MAKMATRTQIKTLLDNFNTTVKSDIDNTLPSTANIIGGNLGPQTGTWMFILQALSLSDAQTIGTQIVTNLNTQVRTYTISYSRRSDDGIKMVSIVTLTGTYRIVF